MDYQEAVRLGREAAKSQWVLGDLALTVETTYAEHTLQDYADEIGVEYKTLLDYLTVAEAYEKSERSDNSTWSVHRIFAGQDDRAKLVKKQWTAAKAREEVKRRAEMAERAKVDEQTFSKYYAQVMKLGETIGRFAWSQPERDKMADLLEKIAEGLRS